MEIKLTIKVKKLCESYTPQVTATTMHL